MGEGEGAWELGVTIPSGWLPALAHGLDYVMKRWREKDVDERVDEPVAEETELEDAELFERMQALATEIRDVDPADAYVVSARDREALFKGVAGALSIQEFELQRLSEYVDPPILRFVVIEQRDAIGRFFEALWDSLEKAEEVD